MRILTESFWHSRPDGKLHTKPEFRSWRRFHRDSLIDFGFRLRVQDATSAKLEHHRLRRFPATGCVAATHPRKRTDARPSGGQRGRVEHRKGKLACAAWPVGDRCGGHWRAGILRAD